MEELANTLKMEILNVFVRRGFMDDTVKVSCSVRNLDRSIYVLYYLNIGNWYAFASLSLIV